MEFSLVLLLCLVIASSSWDEEQTSLEVYSYLFLCHFSQSLKGAISLTMLKVFIPYVLVVEKHIRLYLRFF